MPRILLGKHSFSSPFHGAEADQTADIAEGSNQKLPVELQHRGVPEGDRGGQGLQELEYGKGGGRAVLEDGANDGVGLGVDAGIRDAQQKAGEDGQVPV